MWHTFADTSTRLTRMHTAPTPLLPSQVEGGVKWLARGAIEFLWPISLILILLMISISLHAALAESWVPDATFDCCSVIRRMLRHDNSLFFRLPLPLPLSLSVCCMLMWAFLSTITISSSHTRLALQTRSISISGPKRVTMQCEVSHGLARYTAHGTWSSLSFLLPQLQSMPSPWPHQSTAGQSINYRRQFISNKASPLWRLSNTTSNCFITIIGKHLLRQHAEIRRNFEFATRTAHAPIACGKQQQQQQQQGRGDTHLAVARRTYLVLRSSSPHSQSLKKSQNWATN